MSSSILTCLVRAISHRLGELANALIDLLNDLVGGGGARSNAHCPNTDEPGRAQVGIGLHMVNAGTMTLARRDQLARVVAVGAADDDDDVALLRQIDGGRLPILCRPADRVDKANERIG